VLPKLIDKKHSAFLEGRCLVEEVLVANNTVEEIKRKKHRCIIMKINFEKSYNSIRWRFVVYLMKRLRFNGKWIGWLKGCLESSTILVLVNGNPSTKFKPTKDLRQGDPLAIFHFLMVVEGLVGFVRQTICKNMVWVKVGDKRVAINMLQLAYDTIFICHESIQNV